jgi:hypothetical protein
MRAEYDQLNFHEREAKAIRDRLALTEARSALRHAVECIGRVIGNDDEKMNQAVMGLGQDIAQAEEKMRAGQRIRG